MQLYPVYDKEHEPKLPDLEIQYVDFAVWQRKWLTGKTLEKQLNYWLDTLAGVEPVLDIPTDFSRPSFQTYNGDFIIRRYDQNKYTTLKKICEEQDVTLFMLLMAVFQILLGRYSGQEDFCVGTPVANRNRSETEDLIGFFINTLVIRSQINDNPSFSELLKRIKKTTIGAFDHQDLPFETLVEEMHLSRDMSHTPLFQAMLVLNNAPIKKLNMEGLEISFMDFENKTSKFDLIFNFTEFDGHFDAKIEFNTDLFKKETIKLMLDRFDTLMDYFAINIEAKINSVSLLSVEEKELILNKWAYSKRKKSSEKTVSEYILEACSLNEIKTAVIGSGFKLSYRELKDKILSVAYKLQELSLPPESVVAVMAKRSPEMIYGMLGVMHAGYVYLPLDPTYPQERLKFMLEDSSAAALLLQKSINTNVNFMGEKIYFDEINNTQDEQSKKTTREDTAYIIYTSGSTGKPKGVRVSHKAFADHCLDMAEHFKLTKHDTVLQFAALNFDASLEQIIPPLIKGASVLLRDDEIWSPADFTAKCQEYNLSVVNPPTAYWNTWVDYLSQRHDVELKSLRLVIAGGDTMKPPVLEKWFNSKLSGVRLLNAYGPTEAVITATTAEISKDILYNKSFKNIPIGFACANRSLYVVDKWNQPVPAGIPGELLIGGSILAEGYHNLQEQTVKSFISNPLKKNEIVYKTGDKVRWLSDGSVEFLGRIDDQVKIRGFRIEPEEIARQLSDHPDVSESLVTVKSDSQNEKQLIAYFIAKPEKSPKISDLRAYLKTRLAEYMIPAGFMQLEEFPILPGGKINKRVLPLPDDLRTQIETEYAAPRTKTEKILSEIVSEILKIDKVGIYDNFFDLGGHSLLGTQVISRIREHFNVDVPLRSLFENPSVEGISIVIAELQAETTDEKELENMLDELEDLSEEEINKLLNE